MTKKFSVEDNYFVGIMDLASLMSLYHDGMSCTVTDGKYVQFEMED